MTHDELIENEVDDLIEENREVEELQNKISSHDCHISEEDGCDCEDWRERLKELGK